MDITYHSAKTDLCSVLHDVQSFLSHKYEAAYDEPVIATQIVIFFCLTIVVLYMFVNRIKHRICGNVTARIVNVDVGDRLYFLIQLNAIELGAYCCYLIIQELYLLYDKLELNSFNFFSFSAIQTLFFLLKGTISIS